MQVKSKFVESNKIFFNASDKSIIDSGFEIVERSFDEENCTSQTKAFLLKGLMLHYTYNVFEISRHFVVSFDEDTIIITFHLKSNGGIKGKDYEPYLMCDEEFITAQFTPMGNLEFSTPNVMELFRIFITPAGYMEILKNYGDTFNEIVQRIKKKEKGNIFSSPLPISPQMKVIINEIMNYKNTNKNLSRNFYKNKAMELFHLQLEQILALNEKNNSVKLSKPDMQKIHEAGKILKVNFSKPPTLKQLSLMLATNENKLKVGFNTLYNTSVYQFVLGLRMEKAIELMHDRKMSIDQISEIVGYASLAHFTRAFKKVKGISPREFKKSL